MQKTVLLVLASAGILLALDHVRGPGDSAHAQANGRYLGESAELITHLVTKEGHPHMLAVVDPRRKTLGVYHIDVESGWIALKSVRNVSWDLELPHFNSESPSPQDIRKGLEQVR